MDATQTALSSEARVPTGMPRRYLHQLCKHFQHRLPVTLDDWQGCIEFSGGICQLDAAAEGGVLLMRLTAGDDASRTELEGVVARHLERLGYRDEIKVHWTRSNDGPADGMRTG